ncbi:diguanylate cyclase domain-containing protein [Cryptosporangium sp. NPDC051539]|uniref:diguanylate cyclase domain-containing protein n=1 Tax=Cryptosporangium sp. NPDC051539 TaxID=3363962 RepID=UPI0037B45C30
MRALRTSTGQQAVLRERAVAAGAARLAASSERDVVHRTAIETTLTLVAVPGTVLLALGHDLRHQVVAAAPDSPIGRTLDFEPLPPDLVAALRRGDPVYLDGAGCEHLRTVVDLPPRKGSALILRLRAGGRDVGALVVSAHRPLGSEVRDAVTAWSTQVAASLAGLELTEELLHRAAHDPLTGLATRDLTHRRLAAALARTPTAFILVQVPRASDDVLTTVADRLTAASRPGDSVGRLGAEEFGVVLPGVDDPDTATEVATAFITALRAPIRAGAHEVSVGGAIGVALGTPGTTADDIATDAAAALHRARAAAPPGDRFAAGSEAFSPRRLYAVS